MAPEIRGRGVAGVSHVSDPDLSHHERHGTGLADVPTSDPLLDKAGESFTIFAAMPFDPSFDDVFFVGVRGAALFVGGRAVRVDQVLHGADAVLETQRQLRLCTAVVADVSRSEPDVLYELGFAHALGKPCVQICSTSYDYLPFMVRNRETLLYGPGRTHVLADQLGVYLASILGLTPRRENEE